MIALLPEFLQPTLGEATYVALRCGYGIGLLLTVFLTARHRRRYFTGERWGGYAESTPLSNALENPTSTLVLLVAWSLSAFLLVIGRYTILAAVLNVLVCRHYFVDTRWKGVLRGMGAPGYMTYWIGAVVAVLELTRRFAPNVVPLALLAAQIDFALIMLSAGVYKISAGYRRNAGMQYGQANPQWGYWWRLWTRVSPEHLVFRFMNHSAWFIQTLSAVLLLIPATQPLGAVMIIASFLFVATQIRLGVLCYLVILGTLIYFPAGGWADAFLQRMIPVASSVVPTGRVPALAAILEVATTVYLVMLPIAFGTLFLNFYGRRSLLNRLQSVVEAYANFFGIVLWRVFSVDHTNFYVLIHRHDRESGMRELVSEYDRIGSRFNDVGEAIAVTSIFTTLKYYPSDSERFVDRLLRYARTIPCGASEVLVFEYVVLRDGTSGFSHDSVAEVTVDLATNEVTERVLEEGVCIRTPHELSPVFEGRAPGSYVARGA